jgi:hypothetical protein
MLSPEEGCFLTAEPVAVHDVEKKAVPSVSMRDGGKKALDLHLREVGKLLRDWANDDVHPVSFSCVDRDLDVFTHFRGLSRPLTLTLLRRVSRAAAYVALCLTVGHGSMEAQPVPTAAAPGAEEALSGALAARSGADNRLFTAVGRGATTHHAGSAELLPEHVSYAETFEMHTDLLGQPVIHILLDGVERTARLVRSNRRADGESFLYSTGTGELLSVFTTFYDKNLPAYAYVHLDNKGYFISPEGEHHLAVNSLSRPQEEAVHVNYLPVLLTASAESFASGMHVRQRAVRSGPEFKPVRIVIAADSEYVKKVGGKNKAIARLTHYVDRQNAAYENSAFSGRVELEEIVFFDSPVLPENMTMFNWAIDDPTHFFHQTRARNKAGATIIFSGVGHVNMAARTAPGFINPDTDIAVVTAFFADWDSVDIETGIHEFGHVSGGDHNPENAPPQAQDPQGTARDWYDCEAALYGILSYNACDGKWLQIVEMYSGLNSVFMGKVRGGPMQNNVGMFAKVFETLKGEHE